MKVEPVSKPDPKGLWPEDKNKLLARQLESSGALDIGKKGKHHLTWGEMGVWGLGAVAAVSLLGGWGTVVWGLPVTVWALIGLAASMISHEGFGHALMAKFFNRKTGVGERLKVSISFSGGISVVTEAETPETKPAAERQFRDAQRQFWIALAGPVMGTLVPVIASAILALVTAQPAMLLIGLPALIMNGKSFVGEDGQTMAAAYQQLGLAMAAMGKTRILNAFGRSQDLTPGSKVLEQRIDETRQQITQAFGSAA